MIFELDKEYIVKVTDKGIIPIEEFHREKYYNKDTDDLDVLTDEEKDLIIQSTCSDLIKKIDNELKFFRDDLTCKTAAEVRNQITEIIQSVSEDIVVARGILLTADEKNRNDRFYAANILFPPSSPYNKINNR